LNYNYTFGPWEPDKINNEYQGLTHCEGVYAAANGYNAIPGPLEFTFPLPGSFRGAGASIASDGTSYMFGATPAGLFKYTGSTWISVIAVVTTERWRFERFDDTFIAVNGGVPQKVNLLTGVGAALGGSPPPAKYVAVVGNFTALAGDVANNNLITWGGFANPNFWTAGTNQSGFQPIHEGGAIEALVGGEFGLIFQRSRITRMTYIGGKDVFQFDEVEEDIGTIAPDSVVHVGGTTYFLSERGFMKTRGDRGGAVPIGVERVDKTFFKLHTRASLVEMMGAYDPRTYNIVWTIGGVVYIYNTALDRWTLTRGAIVGCLTGFTSNISLDGLDALYPGGLDTIPYSLDDPRFQGGEPFILMAMADNSLATLAGPKMAAKIKTGMVAPMGHRDSLVSRLRPETDARGGCLMAAEYNRRSGDSLKRKVSGVMRASGDMPIIARGRHIGWEFTVAEGSDWSFVQGFKAAIAQGGSV
jgi:hypothetical protein